MLRKNLMMIMTMRMKLTKSLMKLGESNRKTTITTRRLMIYGLQDELCKTVAKVESDVKEELDDDHHYQNEIDEEFNELRGAKQE